MSQSIKTVEQQRPISWDKTHNLLSTCAALVERSFGYNLGDKGC
jgi:hypothetical protein